MYRSCNYQGRSAIRRDGEFARATAAAYRVLIAKRESGAVDLEAASLRSASASRVGPTITNSRSFLLGLGLE